MRDNLLGEASAHALARGLCAPSCALTELDVSWNLLRPHGVEALCGGLSHNRSLLTLDLSWNGAGERGGLAIPAILAAGSALTSLNAAHNGLGTGVAVRLAGALSADNLTLTNLDLSGNPIGAKGCEALMRALADNTALRSLGLLNVEAAAGRLADGGNGGPGGGSGGGATDAATILASFDPDYPEGQYVLDLSNSWEHWVACKLRDISIRHRVKPSQEKRTGNGGGRGEWCKPYTKRPEY